MARGGGGHWAAWGAAHLRSVSCVVHRRPTEDAGRVHQGSATDDSLALAASAHWSPAPAPAPAPHAPAQLPLALHVADVGVPRRPHGREGHGALCPARFQGGHRQGRRGERRVRCSHSRDGGRVQPRDECLRQLIPAATRPQRGRAARRQAPVSAPLPTPHGVAGRACHLKGAAKWASSVLSTAASARSTSPVVRASAATPCYRGHATSRAQLSLVSAVVSKRARAPSARSAHRELVACLQGCSAPAWSPPPHLHPYA